MDKLECFWCSVCLPDSQRTPDGHVVMLLVLGVSSRFLKDPRWTSCNALGARYVFPTTRMQCRSSVLSFPPQCVQFRCSAPNAAAVCLNQLPCVQGRPCAFSGAAACPMPLPRVQCSCRVSSAAAAYPVPLPCVQCRCSVPAAAAVCPEQHSQRSTIRQDQNNQNQHKAKQRTAQQH